MDSAIHSRIQNGTVQLELIEWPSPGSADRPTLLFVPGMLGTAETFRKEIESNWRDYRCASISLRGRGKSGAPLTGYTLQDHINDLGAVSESLKAKNGLILIAHSRGVPYGLGFALENLNQIKGLVLLEHPPLHLPIEPGWAEKVIANRRDHFPTNSTLKALQAEADFKNFIPSLSRLTCPVLWVAGGLPGSMLNSHDLSEWAGLIPNCKTWVEKDSGHELETLQLRPLMDWMLNPTKPPFSAKMDSVQISDASQEEIQKIAEIEADSYHPFLVTSASAFLRIFNELTNENFLKVLRSKKEILGFAHFSIHQPEANVCSLWDIAIARSARRRGMGRISMPIQQKLNPMSKPPNSLLSWTRLSWAIRIRES